MAMKEYPLSLEEQRKYGATHAFVMDYTDLTDTAGLTKTLALVPGAGTIGVGWLVKNVKLKVITAFAGCTTLTLSFGDANSVARYMAAQDLKATAGTWYATQAAAIPYLLVAGDNGVKGKFTATVDNLTALTAGKALLLVDAVNLNDMPQSR